MAQTLQRTPVHDRHVALGARMVPFAGWEMPVQYGGIIDEHRTVRSAVGLFDLSHMGEIGISGSEALAFARYAVVSDSTRTSLWILSRAPSLDATTYEGIVSRLRAQRYPVDQLVPTPQRVLEPLQPGAARPPLIV